MVVYSCALTILAACGRDRPSSPEQPETTTIRQAATIANWAPSTAYSVGALVTFSGITYQCLQGHTSQVGWEPPKTPALWVRPGAAGVHPWANQTAYVTGSGVSFNGLVYRCIQGHTSQTNWTPPTAPTLWKATGNVLIPPGVSGSLAFVFKTKNLPAGITNGLGLIQRDPFGDPAYTELLDSQKRAVGEVFHRVSVQGGEVFELYLQANKTKATSSPAMSAATYSSDPTMNMAVDPTFPDHVAQPLQTDAQRAANIWSLRWESFKFGDAGRDGNFNDLSVELRLEAPCNNSMVICTDPNLVVSSHDASKVDYRTDLSVAVAAALPGIPAGPLQDPAGGEGDATPKGTVIRAAGRVDVLRWSFSQTATDFSAATPAPATDCQHCSLPGPAVLGGGLWSLEIARIHRPRAEAFVSSFGPGVFSNFDAKLALRPGGIGNQNTVQLFDPESDAPPVTFFELSQQDGDAAVDGRYRDTGTRAYTSLTLFNASGGVESNPFSAKTAVATRQTGEQLKFEIINVQGTGATELQGRLTAVHDRNGNAATATYQFAASSSDSQLGGDRKKLWLINRVTDPHGVHATFSYQFRSGTSRWVVSSVALPDQTVPQYQYGTDATNLDRLTRVVHANGDTANFSRTWDAASQSWALSFKDVAVAGDARTWKTVFVTGSTYTTADGVVHNQEPNLVRRIVNEDGEQVYKAIEDPNDPGTTFFREGQDRLTRLKVDPTGLPRETAHARTVSADPLLATYAVAETYSGDVLGMIQRATDGLGNERTFGRDSKTRAITSATARGGSTAVFTLNALLRPTRTVDRLLRITDATYDSKGNPLTIKHAVGTSNEATWTYQYNSKGQVTKVTDPNSKVTDYAYDTAGFLTSITEPPDVSGGTRAIRRFEPSPVGRLSAAVDASGRRVTFSYDSRGRLQVTAFPDTTTETIAYGSAATAGLRLSKTNRRGIIEGYSYDATRRPKQTTHASGRPEQTTTVLDYLAGTELPSRQTTAGERVEFGYDERLRPTTRTVFTVGDTSLVWQKGWDDLDQEILNVDPYGRRTFRVLDANGRLARTVRELVPNGVPGGSDPKTLARILSGNPPYVIEDFVYDAMNQVKVVTDPRGVATTIDYDGQGRRKTLIQAAGAAEQRKTTFEYDGAGNLTKQIEPRTFTEGQTFQTVLTYTGRNLPKTRVEASGSADAATTSFTYTLTGKVATATDPRGGLNIYGYDTCCDRLTSVKDPGGFTTGYTYDAEGNRTVTTNPLGATTTRAFDGRNRVIGETDQLGKSTVYTHDDDLTDGVGLDDEYSAYFSYLGFGPKADGTAVESTNAENESTVTVRDGAGRVVLSISPAGGGTFTTHDALEGGLVETATTNPVGGVTRERADGAGRVRVSLDGADESTTRTFDPAGNLLATRDPNAVGRDCVFDGLGQRKSCTDTQGDTTLWNYDAAGNLTLATDGELIPTTCAFDFRNRKKSCTVANATSLWTYDGNSNVTSVRDGDGRLTSFTYDSRNLRATQTFADSTGPTDRVTTLHDGAGRLDRRTDQDGNTVVFTYDAANRLRQKTAPDGKVDSFEYDDVGRLTSAVSQRYGTTVSRGYDEGGRLDTEALTVAPGPTYMIDYTHDDHDRLTALQYPDGSSAVRTYTVRDQLETVTLGGQPIVTFAYDVGARLSSSTFGNGIVETRGYRDDHTVETIDAPGVGALAYTYDHKKQKRSEIGSATSEEQSFDYDPQGRLTAWASGDDAQTWSLTPAGDWQTTTRNGATEARSHNAAHELTAVSSVPMTYDGRGNLTGDDVGNQLTWDFDDRLRTHVLTETGAGASYLYDATGRRVARTAGTTTTVFVHAGDEVVAEYVNGSLGTAYVLGATIDRPVAYVAGANRFWYSTNHLGSIAAVTNAAGAVVERYSYDAYGERTVLAPDGTQRTSSSVGNQVGFTGRYHDAITGLVDFRFRQYHPRLGRFLGRDDGFHDGLNLYAAYFVPNATDPTGHRASGDNGQLSLDPSSVACPPSAPIATSRGVVSSVLSGWKTAVARKGVGSWSAEGGTGRARLQEEETGPFGLPGDRTPRPIEGMSMGGIEHCTYLFNECIKREKKKRDERPPPTTNVVGTSWGADGDRKSDSEIERFCQETEFDPCVKAIQDAYRRVALGLLAVILAAGAIWVGRGLRGATVPSPVIY